MAAIRRKNHRELPSLLSGAAQHKAHRPPPSTTLGKRGITSSAARKEARSCRLWKRLQAWCGQWWRCTSGTSSQGVWEPGGRLLPVQQAWDAETPRTRAGKHRFLANPVEAPTSTQGERQARSTKGLAAATSEAAWSPGEMGDIGDNTEPSCQAVSHRIHTQALKGRPSPCSDRVQTRGKGLLSAGLAPQKQWCP